MTSGPSAGPAVAALERPSAVARVWLGGARAARAVAGRAAGRRATVGHGVTVAAAPAPVNPMRRASGTIPAHVESGGRTGRGALTYCVGIWTRHGLVMASDSRTNAGHDEVNVARKMHTFVQPGERGFILLRRGR